MPLADATQTRDARQGKVRRPVPSAPIPGRFASSPRRACTSASSTSTAASGACSAASALPSTRPRTELVLTRDRAPSRAKVPTAPARFPRCAASPRSSSLDAAYDVKITSAIPAHAGLGSGTQLALAAGAALMDSKASRTAPRDLGEIVDRGARSAIGMALVRAGRLHRRRRPRRHRPRRRRFSCAPNFPRPGARILVLDARTKGVHGEAEAKAFAALPPLPDAAAAHVCRLVLMQLVPGLMEADIEAFGRALTRDPGHRRRPLRSCTRRQSVDQPGGRARHRNAARRRRVRASGRARGDRPGSPSSPRRKLPTASIILSIEDARAEGLEILDRRGAQQGRQYRTDREHISKAKIKSRGRRQNERSHSDSAHARRRRSICPRST